MAINRFIRSASPYSAAVISGVVPPGARPRTEPGLVWRNASTAVRSPSRISVASCSAAGSTGGDSRYAGKVVGPLDALIDPGLDHRDFVGSQ